ncbi:MAG: putative bifunctional diguanylate cyclase/phosphodiesterase [Gemmatimonadales bacterium]|jgi:diguanylate cyclase (GGDEF)-like protein/PAS domain S-box-containing protein
MTDSTSPELRDDATLPPGSAGNPLPLWAIAVALYGATYVAWIGYGNPAATPFGRALVNAVFLPLASIGVLLFFRAGQRQTANPTLRRALLFFAASFGATGIGNLIWFVQATWDGRDPTHSWANIAYFANYGLILSALLSLPRARRTRIEWWKFALDAATVTVGGGIAIWCLVLRPAAPLYHGTIDLAFGLAYPLADLLLLLGITTVLLRRPATGTQFAFALLVIGQLSGIAADLLYSLAYPLTGYTGVHWTDGLYIINYVLMIWAGERYVRMSRRRFVSGPDAGDSDENTVHRLSALPYAAALVAAFVVISESIGHVPHGDRMLMAALIPLAALLLARQLLAVHQNTLLLSERAQRAGEDRFRALVEHSCDVIMIVDTGFMVRFVSPAINAVLGVKPPDVVGQPLTSLLHPDDVVGGMGFLDNALRCPGLTPSIAWRVRHGDGDWRRLETVCTNRMDDPNVQGLVLNTRDVTERAALEGELRRLAFHDGLTGLANRALFRDRVEHALASRFRAGTGLTVVFLDLNDFKKVNDSRGHGAGDQLLVAVADRLRTCVRGADTLARLGGDEFAILLEGSGTSIDDRIDAVVDRVRQSLSRPLQLESGEVAVEASIGLAHADPGDTVDALLRRADVDMYLSKRRGKRGRDGSPIGLDARDPARLELEAELRHGIERGELVLQYQPIADLSNQAVRGVEALVRWAHPTRGMLPPVEFIPLAEDTGLIVPLGQWVLAEACAQGKKWYEASGGAWPQTMTVNLSGRQLVDGVIVDTVRQALEVSGLPPRILVLEITETVVLHQLADVVPHLRALKALGVRIAIDDFGIGYSSLSRLHTVPADLVKIAKPFVDDIASSDRASMLVRGIVALSATLGLETIAEGIEHEAQRSTLESVGCGLGQGYHFARPLEAEEILERFAVPAAATAPATTAA